MRHDRLFAEKFPDVEIRLPRRGAPPALQSRLQPTDEAGQRRRKGNGHKRLPGEHKVSGHSAHQAETNATASAPAM